MLHKPAPQKIDTKNKIDDHIIWRRIWPKTEAGNSKLIKPKLIVRIRAAELRRFTEISFMNFLFSIRFSI